MDRFVDALISEEKSSLIPDEYDYWKDVIAVGIWILYIIGERKKSGILKVNGTLPGSWKVSVFRMFSSVPRGASDQTLLKYQKNMVRL